MIRIVASSVLAGLLAATSVDACGYHNLAPLPSMVNRLLSSDEIVLARASPDNPFEYQAVEALVGDLRPVDIQYLVDSTTRRRLVRDDNASVLFARSATNAEWERLAFVDAALAPVLEMVMEKLPDWEAGDDDDRISFFAALIGHPNKRIHHLALRELDQPDYAVLRDLELDVEPARLLVRFDDPTEAEFRNIRILLLGLSGEEDVRPRLELGVERATIYGDRYLGAYATALIELVGPDAVTELASRYLTDRVLPFSTRDLFLEAISLHGQTGDPAMEEAISIAIQSALWIDPGLAGAVARRFGARSDWSHHSALEALLMEGAVLASADMQDVSQYLMFARDSTGEH